MTRAAAVAIEPAATGTANDQAHETGAERPQYRVRPQDDGGAWQGPTEAAWTTRILRGARPPKPSTGIPREASIPHG